MKLRHAARTILVLAVIAATLSPAPSLQAASARLDLVASGFASPVAIAAPGDGSGRLFVVEQAGRIRIYKNGAIRSGSYIDIRGKVKCCGEMGMLGLAFHPNFENNGKFYVTYSDNDQDFRLSRFVDPSPAGDSAPESSEKVRLQINHRANSNHWGGQLAFGSKALYISTGDGGGQNDPGNNAQDKGSLLGKILRIDVDCTNFDSGKQYCVPDSNPFYGDTPGLGEIWHYGLRNPWKFSFDSATGAMWIGDVGQDRYEEIDRTERKGRNFGWPCREGFYDNPARSCSVSGATNPIYNYSQANNRCAIIGGYVVRDSEAAPGLERMYVFADYCSREIWALRTRSDGSRYRDYLTTAPGNPTAFGRSDGGNIYVATANGRLYRLET